MNIDDDKTYNIKLRPQFHADFILNTNNKSKEEIYIQCDNRH